MFCDSEREDGQDFSIGHEKDEEKDRQEDVEPSGGYKNVSEWIIL